MNGRELVLDILLTLERDKEYSHRLIKSALDKVDYLESRQKAFIKRLAEGTLERQLELDYYLDCYSTVSVKKMKPLIRCLMRMSVYQLLYMDTVPDSAVCNEACKLAAKRGFGNLKGFVNGVLRRISAGKQALPMPDEKKEPLHYLSVRYSMPEWLIELWMEEYGREITVTLLEALLEIHPVSLRFSLRMTGQEREIVCEQMRKRGVEIIPGSYLPYVVLAEHTENPAELPGFDRGLFMVQDVSSALAVEAAGIRDGDYVPPREERARWRHRGREAAECWPGMSRRKRRSVSGKISAAWVSEMWMYRFMTAPYRMKVLRERQMWCFWTCPVRDWGS